MVVAMVDLVVVVMRLLAVELDRALLVVAGSRIVLVMILLAMEGQSTLLVVAGSRLVLVVILLAVQGDRALFMLASRRVMVRVVRLLAVQSQRTLALTKMAMVNLVMAMMRRLPVMRMVSLVLAVQVHSRLLLLDIASEKNFTCHHVAED